MGLYIVPMYMQNNGNHLKRATQGVERVSVCTEVTGSTAAAGFPYSTYFCGDYYPAKVEKSPPVQRSMYYRAISRSPCTLPANIRADLPPRTKRAFVKWHVVEALICLSKRSCRKVSGGGGGGGRGNIATRPRQPPTYTKKHRALYIDTAIITHQ